MSMVQNEPLEVDVETKPRINHDDIPIIKSKPLTFEEMLEKELK